MVQKDYILRMIEQIGGIVAELRRRIMQGDTSGVESESRNLATAAGVDIGLARVLDPEALVSLLSPDGRPDPTRVWLAAELMYLEGLAYHQDGHPAEAVESLAKARALFGVARSGILPLALPDTGERLREVEALLDELTETD